MSGPLTLAAFLALAPACAPSVDARTLAAVVAAENSFHPYAVAVNENGRTASSRRFATAEEATVYAEGLIARGVTNFDTGAAQINWRAGHLQRRGLPPAAAFDPCTAARIGGEVLVRVREAATAQEAARLARQAATDAKKEAKAREEAASARAVAVAKVAETTEAAAAAAVAQDAAGQASRRAAEAHIDARRASRVQGAPPEALEAAQVKQDEAATAAASATAAEAQHALAASADAETRQASSTAKTRFQAIEAQQGDVDTSAEALASG